MLYPLLLALLLLAVLVAVLGFASQAKKRAHGHGPDAGQRPTVP